jgi:hypothetical protein
MSLLGNSPLSPPHPPDPLEGRARVKLSDIDRMLSVKPAPTTVLPLIPWREDKHQALFPGLERLHHRWTTA